MRKEVEIKISETYYYFCNLVIVTKAQGKLFNFVRDEKYEGLVKLDN